MPSLAETDVQENLEAVVQQELSQTNGLFWQVSWPLPVVPYPWALQMHTIKGVMNVAAEGCPQPVIHSSVADSWRIGRVRSDIFSQV